MHKGTLWIFFVMLLGYLMLMFCVSVADAGTTTTSTSNQHIRPSYWNPNATSTPSIVNQRSDVALSRQFNAAEEARRRHGLYHHHRWWWPALAVAYWVKVKVVIVSFFVGSAIYLGLRYFWPHHKCHGEIYRESPIIYDHPPHHSFSSHDHSFSSIPYSANFDPTSFDTTGGSLGGIGSIGSIGSTGSSGGGGGYTYDIGSSGSDLHRRKRRSIKQMRLERDVRMRQRQTKQQQQQQQQLPQRIPTEEQIGDMMFYFLGLDSRACRRRFICEMEFRSRLHPLTSMAFRIVGRSFFGKYTNERNEAGQAKSFDECAAVNPECVFIEQAQDDGEEQDDGNTATEQSPAAVETVDNAIENDLNGSGDEKSEMEKQNEANLIAERRITRRRHVDGHVNLVAQRIWARAN